MPNLDERLPQPLVKMLHKCADRSEPVFVLRAQDALAPVVVDYWVTLLQGIMGKGSLKAYEVGDIAKDMRRWAGNNRRKIPD